MGFMAFAHQNKSPTINMYTRAHFSDQAGKSLLTQWCIRRRKQHISSLGYVVWLDRVSIYFTRGVQANQEHYWRGSDRILWSIILYLQCLHIFSNFVLSTPSSNVGFVGYKHSSQWKQIKEYFVFTLLVSE
jgi:hypothetical protein